MSRSISNSDDVLDSRNVIARIEELESEFELGIGRYESPLGKVQEVNQ